MRRSVWAYPWDVSDEGAGNVLGWLADAGFDAIDLACNYHAISTFSPRNPRRTMFYSEQGAVYFPARIERYGLIKPKLYEEPAVLQAYDEVSRRLDEFGFQLNAWVIGMFQPWIARAHPQTALENAFGQHSYAQTCPSNPHVREYLAALMSDLVEQFPVHSLFLESVGHPAFAYGWVRERVLVELDDWTRFLLGLCFCNACHAAGRDEGADVPALRTRVAAEAWQRLQAAPPAKDGSAPARAPDWWDVDPDLKAYRTMRRRGAAAIVAEVHRNVAAAGSCRVGVEAEPDPWTDSGITMEDMLPIAGTLALPDPVERHAAAAAVKESVAKSGRDIELLASQSGADAQGPHSPEFRAKLDTIRQFGVDRVSVYNFGLLRPDTLRAIGAALSGKL